MFFVLQLHIFIGFERLLSTIKSSTYTTYFLTFKPFSLAMQRKKQWQSPVSVETKSALTILPLLLLKCISFSFFNQQSRNVNTMNYCLHFPGQWQQKHLVTGTEHKTLTPNRPQNHHYK